MKVQTETKEAAASIRAKRSARTQNYYQLFYALYASQSSIKEQLGELLLYLQRPLSETDRQRYWHQFELSLRMYLDLKLSGLLNG